MTKRPAFAMLLSVVVLTTPNVGVAQEAVPQPITPGVEAYLRDDATVVQEAGLDGGLVGRLFEHQERFGQLVHSLERQYPESFGGGWTVYEPELRSFVRFKGFLPEGIHAVVPGFNDVEFIPGSTYSLHELESRTKALYEELVQQGYKYAVVSYSVREARIDATVTRTLGRSDEQSMALLSEQFESPDVKVAFQDGLVSGIDAVEGGTQLLRNGANHCTSGFVVVKTSTSTRGISTAGHCAPTHYKEPGGYVWTTTFQAEHRGAFGDAEWHTTPATELDNFYADVNDYRDVTSVKAETAITEGATFCTFGRASGFKRCNTVLNPSVYVIFDGIRHERMVAGVKYENIPGDSGAPVFYGGAAWGVHSGWVVLIGGDGKMHQTFSKAALFGSGLGVSVATS